MITLYFSTPGTTSICKLYDMADTPDRKRFDESAKGPYAYYSLFCRVLLRKALAAYGITCSDVEIYANKYGKEYIKDRPVYYNISHTGGLVCAAVSDHEIGVDCETVRDIDHKQIARRFFTKNDNKQIDGAYDSRDEFFKIWTKKESYVKFTGQGFSRILGSFDSADFEDIQSTFKYKNTYVTLTGDVSHVEFRYERI